MHQQPSQHSEPMTFDKVWQMFQETKEMFQETDKKILETDRILTEKFQESRQESDQRSIELDKKFQETDKKFQETDREISRLASLFTGQWGKLVEALLAPGCLELFQKRGIKIFQCFPNVKVQKNGKQMEIDLMLVNDTELVVTEIKTTARVSHVKELLAELKQFKTFFPRYADCRVYGAIAAVRFEEGCDSFTASQGLFVIKATGEGLVKITNDAKFKPKAF